MDFDTLDDEACRVEEYIEDLLAKDDSRIQIMEYKFVLWTVIELMSKDANCERKLDDHGCDSDVYHYLRLTH